MRYKTIDKSLFIKNRQKLTAELKSNSIAVICSNNQMPRNGDQYFQYRQNSDLFYLTGIEQEKTILVLCPSQEKEENREILFLIEPDEKLEIWEGHKLRADEAETISGIKKIKKINDFDSIVRELIVQADNIYFNIDENSKFSTNILSSDYMLFETIKHKFPLHQYCRLAPLLCQQRLVKEPQEIDLMQKACNITTDAFNRVLKFVKPGVKEYEIEAEITYEFIRQGAAGHAYQPIVASGKDNCVLHYVSNDKICNDGDLVLLDFGAEYAGYSADTTRTIPVNGKFTPRQRDVYSAVLSVMKDTKKLMKPGTTINLINEKVNELIAEQLKILGLITELQAKDTQTAQTVRMKYYMHGTSHFMGLDVHDVGMKDTILKPGMVLSCEPGIYIAEENIGIRLENDILITNNEPIDLLENEPIEIEDIERLMVAAI